MIAIPTGIRMLLNVRKEPRVDRMSRQFYHDVLEMKCDTCGKEWEMRGSKTRVLSRKTHSCSKECNVISNRNGGARANVREHTCLEKFGTKNPYASESVKKKIRATNKEKFGHEHPMSSSVVRAKTIATYVEKYGVENPMSSIEIQERYKKTMKSRWSGAEWPMQISHVREAMMSGSMEKHGVPYPVQSTLVRAEMLAKRDKNAWLSKPEKQLRILLEERFGVENVKVQQLIERKWSLDFYVVPINTWISFDGVYWHGLNRPIDDIRKSHKPQDVAIVQKWEKDRELDEYAKKAEMRIVRITDLEFKTNAERCMQVICGNEPTT